MSGQEDPRRLDGYLELQQASGLFYHPVARFEAASCQLLCLPALRDEGRTRAVTPLQNAFQKLLQQSLPQLPLVPQFDLPGPMTGFPGFSSKESCQVTTPPCEDPDLPRQPLCLQGPARDASSLRHLATH